MHEAAYGGNNPYGSSIYASCLGSLSFDAVKEYRAKNYHGSNLIIASNGVNLPLLKDYAIKHLGKVPSGFANDNKANYVGADIRQSANLCGNVYAGVAFPIASGEGTLYAYYT